MLLYSNIEYYENVYENIMKKATLFLRYLMVCFVSDELYRS